MPLPQTGHLTTHEELEALGLSLQDWLNLTAKIPANLPATPATAAVSDSWAEGNTDCAFSFNNCTAIQRTHSGNDWNFFGVDLASQGHATYTYMLQEPVLVQTLSDETAETPGAVVVWDNTARNIPFDFSNTYTRSTERTTSLTVTNSASLTISTGMDIEGFSFNVSASFDTSRTDENSKTQSDSTTDVVSATLPPGSSASFQTFTSVRSKLMLYEVVFAIGSDNPQGSIAKATQNKGTWDTFFRIEDIAGAAKTQSKASYKVQTTVTTTSIRVTGPSVQGKLTAGYTPDLLSLHVGP